MISTSHNMGFNLLVQNAILHSTSQKNCAATWVLDGNPHIRLGFLSEILGKVVPQLWETFQSPAAYLL